MTCTVCRKPRKPNALTCSATCRKHKQRVGKWISSLADYEFTESELDALRQFAYEYGVKPAKLVAKAFDATKERQAIWGNACRWCGDGTEQRERLTCSTACRVSVSRLRRKVRKPDNGYRWIMDNPDADVKGFLSRYAEKAWGTIEAIEWRYGYDIALRAAQFCYENRGEQGTYYVSW